MVEFAGWEMPIQYEGIIPEHMAVRTALGIFDVSHMGKIEITGNGAKGFVSMIQTNLPPDKGKSVYGHFLNDDGIILDDTIIGNLGDGYICVPNAATKDMILSWFKEHLTKDTFIHDLTDEWFCIAIQGKKVEVFARDVFNIDLRGMPFMSLRRDRLFGEDVIVSRSGYTGEDGIEILGPNRIAEKVFLTSIEKGGSFGIKPCGLGARDTLRLEKGMLLSGQDFHMDRTPLETNCSWVVKWDHEFIGKGALLKKKDSITTKLKGIRMQTRSAIPRHGSKVYQNGVEIGVCTSGSFSPVLGVGIGMAYLPKDLKGSVEVEVRGTLAPGEIVRTPFV